MTRLNFLKSLGRELFEDQLKYRATLTTLPRQLKFRIEMYVKVQNKPLPEKLRQSNRCAFCE